MANSIPLKSFRNKPRSEIEESVFEPLSQRPITPEDLRLRRSFALSAAPSRSTSVGDGLGESAPLLENTQSDGNSSLNQFRSRDHFLPDDYLKPFFPQLAPGQKRSTWKRLTERKQVLLGMLVLSSAVLLANIAWVAYFAKTSNIQNGIGTIYTGTRSQVKSFNLWIHLLINVLSTILLGASNFCMQLLVAPNREEIDKAHRQTKWLDIGTQSMRNLMNVSNHRKILWFCLAISSGGLHLVYNSAVFQTLPFFQYKVVVVGNDYEINPRVWPINTTSLGADIWDYQYNNTLNYDILDTKQCINRYSNPLLGGRDVVVVTNTTHCPEANNGGTSLFEASVAGEDSINWNDAQWWMCTGSYIGLYKGLNCGPTYLTQHAADWVIFQRCAVKVDYCLSAGIHQVHNNNQMQFSVPIMITVCVLNFIKVVCVFCTFWTFRQPRATLFTVGDAVASFCATKDDTTEGLCWLPFGGSYDNDFKWPEPLYWKRWRKGNTKWHNTVSSRTYYSTISLCVAMCLLVVTMLIFALIGMRGKGLHIDPKSILDIGLGVQPSALMGGPFVRRDRSSSFAICVLFANIFQLMFSVVYLMYNRLITIYAIAQEWSHWSAAKGLEQRRGLRVSEPQPTQRSSYFISLPYRFGIPTLIASSVLHWLISQAVFVVNTNGFDTKGLPHSTGNTSRVGFSSLGIILALVLGGVMVTVLILIGFRKLPSGIEGMPLASTCSALISSACHTAPEDRNVTYGHILWGVVSEDASSRTGHCSFTTKEDVGPPKESWTYH
ncbi:hypothetical protein EG327_011328 [Venturia inaequalis]|uniref:DUF6536 domain-containing protein n=1 Tax=Venturia inaequalis TaxID=5025 RepID=A0A8H3UD22_VENIN|nr:hypothetical protein EG327_011328 [Venturia inaequalis]